MMTSDHIVNVNESDFEYEVIAYSKQVPVVVDFWAEWCGPCKVLGPMLERLAAEADGSFRLAKVNVDSNPNLALQYSVRSLPNVKAFRDGKMVAEFVGAQPEGRVREFIRALAPSETDLVLEKAQGLLAMNQYSQAEQTFRQFLTKSPNHPVASLGLVRSILLQGHLQEALPLLRAFPPSKEYNQAEILSFLANVQQRAQNAPAYSDDPLEAAYLNALRLITKRNYEAAMDGLLDILRQDKHYRSGEVRKVMLGIFELLGDENPLTRQYRNEMAMVLF